MVFELRGMYFEVHGWWLEKKRIGLLLRISMNSMRKFIQVVIYSEIKIKHDQNL